MKASIIRVDDGFIRINNKIVVKDMNGNWVTAVELTSSEKEALEQFMNAENSTIYDNE